MTAGSDNTETTAPKYLQQLNLLHTCLQYQNNMSKYIDGSCSLDAPFLKTTLEYLWIQSCQQEFEQDDAELPAKYLGKFLQIVNYNTIAENTECLNLIWRSMTQIVSNSRKLLVHRLYDLLEILVEIIKESFSLVQPLSETLPVFQLQQMMYISLVQLLLKIFPKKQYDEKTEKNLQIIPKILMLMCEILVNPDSGVHVRCVAASVVQQALKICDKHNVEDPLFQCSQLRMKLESSDGSVSEDDEKNCPKIGIQILFDVLYCALEANLTIAFHEDIHPIIGSQQDTVYQCIVHIMTNYPHSVLSNVQDACDALQEKNDQVILMLLSQAIDVLETGGQTVDMDQIQRCFWNEYFNIVRMTHHSSQNDRDQEDTSQRRKFISPKTDPQFTIFGNLVRAYCKNPETTKKLENMSAGSLNSKNEIEQLVAFWSLGCIAKMETTSSAVKDCLSTTRFLYNDSLAHWCVAQYLDFWTESGNFFAHDRIRIECIQQWITDILKNIVATQKIKTEEQITLKKIQNLWNLYSCSSEKKQLSFQELDFEQNNLNGEKAMVVLIELKQIATLHFLLKHRFFTTDQIKSFTNKIYKMDKLIQISCEIQETTCFQILEQFLIQIFNFGEQIIKAIKRQIGKLLVNEYFQISDLIFQFRGILLLIQYLINSQINNLTKFSNVIFEILFIFSDIFVFVDFDVFMDIISNILFQSNGNYNQQQQQKLIIQYVFWDEIFLILIKQNVPIQSVEKSSKYYQLLFEIIQKFPKDYWLEKIDLGAQRILVENFLNEMDCTLLIIITQQKNLQVWSWLPVFLAQSKCTFKLIENFGGDKNSTEKLMRIFLVRLQILWSVKDFEDSSCESNSVQRVVVECLHDVIYTRLFKYVYDQKFHADWLFEVAAFALKEIPTLYLGFARHLIAFLEQKMDINQKIQNLPDNIL